MKCKDSLVGKCAYITVISVQSNAVFCRCALPEQWRGIRDEQLDELTGIRGSVFVHSTGFIGGHTTRDGALHMARITLEQQQAATS